MVCAQLYLVFWRFKVLYKSVNESFNEFIIDRSDDKCIRCKVCVRQCAYEVHSYVGDDRFPHRRQHPLHRLPPLLRLLSDRRHYDQRSTRKTSNAMSPGPAPTSETSMPRPTPAVFCWLPWETLQNIPIYWDHMLLDASQVTNPSIDPLREPMELRTYLGKSPIPLRWFMTRKRASRN